MPKRNTYEEIADYVVCVTNNGKEFLIDKSDLELVKRYSWYINSRGYAATEVDNKELLLHRMLMSVSGQLQVDHKDLNRANNRRNNLRIASHAQNMQNRTLLSNNTSGFKGVSWHKRVHKFSASISVEGKLRHIGYFNTAEEAAIAYNRYAKTYQGEFARINSIKKVC